MQLFVRFLVNNFDAQDQSEYVRKTPRSPSKIVSIPVNPLRDIRNEIVPPLAAGPGLNLQCLCVRFWRFLHCLILLYIVTKEDLCLCDLGEGLYLFQRV